MITCLNNATTGAKTFVEFMDAAAGAGFGAIEAGLGELDAFIGQHSVAALRQELKARGLQIGSSGLPLDWRAPEERFREEIRQLPVRLGTAVELGLTRVCTWMPPRWDMPYAQVYAFACDRFGAIADVFARYGALLGLEFVGPQGGFIAKRYKFVTTLAELNHLIAGIGRANVGYLLDSYHLFVGEATMAEVAALDGKRIAQFHINDANPGVPKEELEDLKRLLPGEGAIPLLPMLQALRQTGYDWTLSIETFSEEVKAMGPAAGALRAKQCLDSVMAVL